MLRYFNVEPSFKQQWYRTRDLFGSQIPVTTGGFEQRISYLKSICYLIKWSIYNRTTIRGVYRSRSNIFNGNFFQR